ncbi:uncharacterized protein LOC117225038 [Megalopta genalis]|uniref:uncharacterized protein LOC117225038 n=1 Tax=Megalopta genalis TaxID=115081 RepID=UPI003FD4129A
MTASECSIVSPIVTLMLNATISTEVAYDNLVAKTIKIFRTCTVFDVNDALLFAGEYGEFLRRPELEDLPIALIAESGFSAFDLFTLSRHSFAAFKQFSFLHLFWKLNQFLVVASTQPSLRLLLQRIKDSTWSNSNGHHILIDRRTEARGCVNAYRFLWTAWEYDLVSTIFLCTDPLDGLAIYTYNPYSSKVPDGWENAGLFSGRRGHPWMLFKKKYRDGPKMCEGLWFDKTADLNGYEVRVNAIEFKPHLIVDPDKPGLDRFTGDNSEIVKIVFDKLNATLNVDLHNGTAYELGGVGSHGNMVGMLADVANGVVDMGMNVRSLHATWKIWHTYPHGEDGLCVITQRSGEIAEYIKILSFMSPPVIAANFVVFLIALLALAKYQGVQSAGLNIIRLVTYVSIRRMPQCFAYRIFFSNLFLLILIINALLQSHWASLVTVPVSRPNIRTAEDLKASNYRIYGSKYFTEYLYDPVLRSRFHGVDYDQECKQHVLRSRKSACLDDCHHVYLRSMEENLHPSRRIQQNVQVYATRENWPLFNRVSDLIRGTVEAGLVKMWRKTNTRKLFLKWKRKRLNDKRQFRTLKLKHITFSFSILAIGYSIAAAVFVAEIVIGRYRSCRQCWNSIRIRLGRRALTKHSQRRQKC